MGKNAVTGARLPALDLSELSGGAGRDRRAGFFGAVDSGRSCWPSGSSSNGYPVAQVGLKRSKLVGHELEEAKGGNVLSPRTMSLFYATDFYDQLENTIVPALRAGSVVLADRYIFTLMARDMVRGADLDWLANCTRRPSCPTRLLFSGHPRATGRANARRSARELDYWESGMDLGLSRDWFTSFVEYQRRMRDQFEELGERYGIEELDANGRIAEIQLALRERIADLLREAYPHEVPPVVSGVPKKAVRRRAPVRG